MPNIEEIQAFFFEAMLQGYVDDNVLTSTIAELPGSKTVVFCSPDGKFRLRDVWFEAGQIDFGLTIIWEKLVNSQVFIPVWKMSYQGRYYAEAIPVLKSALRAAYSQKVFYGGRGINYWRLREYVYRNCLGSETGFQKFRGYDMVLHHNDMVLHHNGQFLGSHDYHGGILFDPEK